MLGKIKASLSKAKEVLGACDIDAYVDLTVPCIIGTEEFVTKPCCGLESEYEKPSASESPEPALQEEPYGLDVDEGSDSAMSAAFHPMPETQEDFFSMPSRRASQRSKASQSSDLDPKPAQMDMKQALEANLKYRMQMLSSQPQENDGGAQNDALAKAAKSVQNLEPKYSGVGDENASLPKVEGNLFGESEDDLFQASKPSYALSFDDIFGEEQPAGPAEPSAAAAYNKVPASEASAKNPPPRQPQQAKAPPKSLDQILGASSEPASAAMDATPFEGGDNKASEARTRLPRVLPKSPNQSIKKDDTPTDASKFKSATPDLYNKLLAESPSVGLFDDDPTFKALVKQKIEKEAHVVEEIRAQSKAEEGAMGSMVGPAKGSERELAQAAEADHGVVTRDPFALAGTAYGGDEEDSGSNSTSGFSSDSDTDGSEDDGPSKVNVRSSLANILTSSQPGSGTFVRNTGSCSKSIPTASFEASSALAAEKPPPPASVQETPAVPSAAHDSFAQQSTALFGDDGIGESGGIFGATNETNDAMPFDSTSSLFGDDVGTSSSKAPEYKSLFGDDDDDDGGLFGDAETKSFKGGGLFD